MNNYSTTDFNLSAYLLAAGLELKAYERQGTQLAFLFKDSSKLQDLVDSYYGLSATINPVAFGNAIRNLKSIVHANKNKESEMNSHVEQQRKAR